MQQPLPTKSLKVSERGKFISGTTIFCDILKVCNSLSLWFSNCLEISMLSVVILKFSKVSKPLFAEYISARPIPAVFLSISYIALTNDVANV